MSKFMSPNPLQPISVRVSRQSISRIVVLRLDGVARVSKDARPLFDARIEARDV